MTAVFSKQPVFKMHPNTGDWAAMKTSVNGGGGTWLDNIPPGVNRHLNGSDEQEYYLSPSSGDPSPFSVDKFGRLVITAQPMSGYPFPYVSGALSTYGLFSQRFGRWEITAKLPGGPGARGAVWFLTDNLRYDAEVDLIELWQAQPWFSNQTVIGPRNGVWDPAQHNWEPEYHNPDLSQQMAKYTLDWTPSGMFMSINDVVINAFTNPDGFSDPAGPGLYLILNLAVGAPGSWCGCPDASGPVLTMTVGAVNCYSYISG